jgi:putative tryptophan/tyrosine transport system substrate-binding protein
MRRRDFLGALGGAVAMWPLAVVAQQPELRVVGFLTALGQNDRHNLRDAFRRGLGETGFIEGRNVTIEYRFAENQLDRLSALAADLVGRKVAVIAATGGGATILAAKTSTNTIPIVFTTGGDPVREGFVTSLNRPGGNVTGVSWFGTLLGGKALELLHEFVPNAAAIALMVNRNLPEAGNTITDTQAAARALARELVTLNASSPSEIDAAFGTLRQRGVVALLVGGDPFFTSRRQQIVALAARDSIPAMYANREFVADGGLMSYGNDTTDAYRRAGVYVGRLLNGASPSEMPIDQASKFEFVINRKVADALRLEIPPKFLFSADEVIE